MARFVLIFSILIGLGAAFLGWKTKEQAETLQTSLKDTKGQLANTKATLKKKEDELKETTDKLTQTEETLKKTEMDLTNAKGELANAKETAAKATADAEEKSKKLADIEAQFTDLKTRLGDIKLEEIGPRMKELADAKAKAETELAESKQIQATLQAKANDMEQQVTTKQRVIDEYKTGFVRNGLTGKVLAFNPGWNFVVLNIGDGAGVKVGAQMVVTRAGAMIGKVKVTSVEPKQSIADVLPGTLARGESVQPGDSVVFEGRR